MNNVYNIAGIDLIFQYCFDEFFKDRIDAYKVNKDKAKYQMKVTVEDFINIPKSMPVTIYKNRRIYKEEGFHIITVTNEETNLITHRIDYIFDYTFCHIKLVSSLESKLAEYEYLLSGIMFFDMAINEMRLPIHASAIKYKGDAIVFSAPSGVGKSTHAKLWQKEFPEV